MWKAGPIETALEWVATAWIAACGGFASFNLGNGIPVAAGVVAVAGLATFSLLRRMRGREFALPDFQALAVEPIELAAAEEPLPELLLTRGMALQEAELLLTAEMALQNMELLLTRSQMLNAPVEAARDDELVLDDVLAELRPESRVVQLFDPARMPTAGELKSRIDRHLGKDRASEESQPDASQALYEALADLRRSLA